MEKIDFSSNEFTGFSNGEDILIDTGVLLAYLNSYDSWSEVVHSLFEKYIFADDSETILFLYINPCILNEIMNLTAKNKVIENYLKKHKSKIITDDEIFDNERNVAESMRILLSHDILLPLDAAKDTYLRQIDTYKELGSADSFNVSLANDYGISFLTVDNRLVNHIEENLYNFSNLDRVYYAPPEKQSYR